MPEQLLDQPTVQEFIVDPTFTPESEGIRDRFFRSRLGRLAMAGLAGLGLAGSLATTAAGPAYADNGHSYSVEGTNGEGVWLHGDPGLGDKDDLITLIPEGATVTADCYVNDTPIGERNNPAWLHVSWEGRVGFMTDYYSSSRWNNSNTLHNQGLPFCGENPTNSNSNPTELLQPAESIPIFASYDRNKAAQWALEHARDTPPNAGSCTWFVSNALWRGGIQETAQWNDNFRGVQRDSDNPIQRGSDYAWKTPDFLSYMKTAPYAEVSLIDMSGDNENHLPKAKLGDIMVYDWDGHSDVDHAAIITGFAEDNPQYPLVSGWSEDGSKANKYSQRGWSWSVKNNHFIQNVRDENGNYPNRDMRVYLIHIRGEDEITIQ